MSDKTTVEPPIRLCYTGSTDLPVNVSRSTFKTFQEGCQSLLVRSHRICGQEVTSFVTILPIPLKINSILQIILGATSGTDKAS